MKKVLFITLMFLLAVAAKAQETAAKKPSDWAELKAFHQVMAGTFHPAEEGNFEPIRKRAGEMTKRAAEWAASTPPAEFNKPQIKEVLNKLVVDSRALEALVNKNAPNEEVFKSLSALHDTFHTVVGVCRGEDHEHGKGEEHGKGKSEAKGKGKGKAKGKA